MAPDLPESPARSCLLTPFHEAISCASADQPLASPSTKHSVVMSWEQEPCNIPCPCREVALVGAAAWGHRVTAASRPRKENREALRSSHTAGCAERRNRRDELLSGPVSCGRWCLLVSDYLSVMTKQLEPLLVVTSSTKEKSHALTGSSLQWA